MSSNVELRSENHINESDSEMLVVQPRLGKKGMIALITLCNIIALLSTDMYMPALPEMGQYFHTSDAVMNLTLSGFFLFFAVGMLLFGPVSDRHGRKPVMIAGIILYIVACILCSLATSVGLLIGARMLQALGAGCMVAVSTAIVKDQFTGSIQSSVLSIAQVFGVLGPVLSPIIGAQIYRFFGWKAVFIGQALVVIGTLIVTLLMAETLPEDKRTDGGIISSFARLGVVARNRTFSIFLIGMIMLQMPMMAYISASSFIYQNGFSMDSTVYSYYFAATALASVLGPIIYAVVLRRRNPFTVAYIFFLVALIVGILMLIFGHVMPALFAGLMAFGMMTGAATRPFATATLLARQKGDAGSASSLINFSFTIMGCIGMLAVTGIWNDYIIGVGQLLLIAAGIGAIVLGIQLKTEGRDAMDVHHRAK